MKKFTSSQHYVVGLLMSAILLINIQPIQSQTLGFPDAEGFGKYTTGGRGGDIYHVTNLNDSGTGSFRDAVSQSNRIVVFDVGGIINISSRIVIKKNITVAGQTAPGGGITIYGNGIAFNDDSGNNIIRYIRIRMGKNGDSGKDAVSISAGTNYLFDHVSISWGRDGTLDVNGTGIDNMTFQDCIISQGINNSNHSTGGLMQSGKWSMIRSLYIDNKTRNPKARGTHECINSVFYNWGTNGYIMGDTDGTSECNLIGNYFIYGPSSSSNTHITNTTPTFYVYGSDNRVDSNKDGTLNGSIMTDYKTATVESSPYAYPGVNQLMSAKDALYHVIDNVGASIVRDAVDELLISQLTSFGTAGQIINTEDDNGISGNVGTVASGTVPTDTDQDGMPDYWETANGINPNTSDHNGDNDGDGYTNIEEYLEWIVNNIDNQTIDAFSTIEAETYNLQSGVKLEACDEGGQNVAFIENGDWIRFNNIDFGSGAAGFISRVASTSTSTGNIVLSIDGTSNIIGTCAVTSTGGWQVWSDAECSINTTSGVHDLYLTFTGGSGYLLNLNNFIFTEPTSNSITIEENQPGFCGVDGTVDSNNAGFTASGFANTDNATGKGVNWKINFETSGTHTFTFRYASNSDRPANLIVNGTTVASNINFPSTGAWTTWTTISTTANISAGTYDLRLEATGSNGLGNIDNITVTDASAADCNIVTTYTLSTNVNGQGTVNPSSGTYYEGDLVSVNATPATGWQFAGWSGAATSTSNPVSITMNDNKTLVATFSEIPIPAELVKHGTGSSNQTVDIGTAITSFYYSWANATSAIATGLPTGVTAIADNSAQTITISGTPTEIGNYPFTITTTGGSPDATINGTFTVNSIIETIIIEENTTGFCSVDGTVDSNNAGFTGTGFANSTNALNMGISWSVYVPSGATCSVVFRYANGSTADRTADLLVDGSTSVSSVSFAGTGSWTTWTANSSSSVYLSTGSHTIRLQSTTSNGLANIDYLEFTGPSPEAVRCEGLKKALISTQPEGKEYTLSISPNPAKDEINIQAFVDESHVNIAIYNTFGYLVYQTELNLSTKGLVNETINISDLNSGVYFVVLSSGGKSQTTKLICE
ncbi:MAG: carbohydrate-binding protein [Marinilabiliaceae bacterium]|nr:carbohydrate-binding protein [Marinilabiliaceae bacterium]